MTERFKFRLDPLLRIRRHAEQRRQQALAEVLVRLNEQTDRARRYDAMIRDEHHRLRDGRLVGPLDVRHLAHHRRYVNSVMKAMIQALCERAGTQQSVGQAQNELIQAVRQRKVLDNLRARRHAEWTRRRERIERRELDEMGLRRAARDDEGALP